jgi:hypothetical protein
MRPLCFVRTRALWIIRAAIPFSNQYILRGRELRLPDYICYKILYFLRHCLYLHEKYTTVIKDAVTHDSVQARM